MNNSTQNKINIFLKTIPKNEIIEILNHIDNKICSLHNTSSKDFLFFNKLLKKYYSKIKEIAEANNNISSFFRKDINSFVELIKNCNSQQENHLKNIDESISFLINKMMLLYSSFDLIVVPFKNFKQNLITLKYILANINLHLTYVELPNKNELKEIVQKLNDTIIKATKNNELASEKWENLVSELMSLKNNACVLKSKNNTEVSENIKNLEVELKKIDKEEYWPENFIHRINSHTQNCFASMGEIITNIQYHDIIRQKMEHIQSAQKELIDNLNRLNPNSEEIEDQLKVIVSIPEITEIQVAQLLYTNKDYQTSIEKISSRLIEVSRELRGLSDLYINLTANSEGFQDIFISHLKTTQQSYLNYNKNFKTNWDKTSLGVNKAIENYNTLKGIFSSTFIEEKKIRSEINAFEDLIKSNGHNFSSDLVNRLVLLTSDLKQNSNSLKNSLNNITTHINSLIALFDDMKKNKEHYEIDDGDINKLSLKVDDTKGTCLEYSNVSIKISSEITDALNKIEYYKYFESTIEEIVTKLNLINEKINYEELKQNMSDDIEILERLEELYTMKSERDIHHKLIESGLSASEILNNDSDNINVDDGDIELF